jgi:Domain of unknown function (DUF2341)/Concanavalin A-like lectin/glucanases superfamily/Fibronectin type III domain/SdrD B-like domain/Calx-beta domain/IPT/TIG domain
MFLFKKTLHKKTNPVNFLKNLLDRVTKKFVSGKNHSNKFRRLFGKKFKGVSVLGFGLFTLGVVFVVGFQILQNNSNKSFAASGSIEFAQGTFAKAESSTNPGIVVKVSQTNTENVTVNYNVSGGSAVAGSDFTGNTSGTVTILAGQTQGNIPLSILNNTVVQNNRTIQLTLSVPSLGMTLGGQTTHTYTILDDDQDSNLQTYDAETLPVTSGLSLRLDAGTVATTGANVTSWTDQSGATNSAGQATVANQPTLVQNAINGKPAIRFDGTNDSLVTTNNIIPANSNYTVITVDKRNAVPTTFAPIVANVSNFSGNNAVHFGYISNTNFRFSQFANDLDGTVDSYIAGNPGLTSGTFDSSVGHKLYRNGLEIASNTNTTGLATTDKIGIGVWNNSSFYNGDIGEILIYNRALSTSEQKQVECYLAAKYGTGAAGCNAKLKLHFDASSGTGQTADGAAVSNWQDQSGNGNNAVQATTSKQPTFQNAGINGKPSIRFAGNNGFIATQNPIIQNSSFTNYIVSKATAGSMLLELTSNTNNFASGTHLATTTNTSSLVKRSNNISAYDISTNWAITGNPQLINQSYNGSNLEHKIYLNGTAQTTSNPYPNNAVGAVSDTLYIGGRGTGGSTITGDISEVITLGNNASGTQRTIIDNYLSAKYGITISNSKYSLASGANNKLIGIGSETDLTISRSGGSQGLAISDLTNTLGAGEYVLAAHVGGAATVVATDLPAGVTSRWNRVWGLDKTATNGVDATLSFDLSQYASGTPSNASNYKLLYRSGTTGAFSSIAAVTTITNSDQISFAVTDANLLDGYYTLATADNTSSPLSIMDFPTGLTVTKQANETSASVSWSAVAGATSYTVEYSNDGFTSNINSVSVAGLSTTISGLTSGPTYSFRVTAFSAVQNSVASTVQSVTFAPKITSISPNSGATIGGYEATITGTNLESPEYTRAVTISNTTSNPINNFEGSVILDTESLVASNKLKSDCSDIRVKDLDGGTDLNYWIDGDCNTSNTSIWFKKPTLSVGNSNVYLTYGNPFRGSQSNISNFSFGALLGGPNNKLWLASNSGTSTKTDGAAISSWIDKSGNGNNVTQSTVANQPTLKNNIQNGRPVVRFDGINDFLNNTTSDISSNQRSLIVVAKANTSANKNVFTFKRTGPIRSYAVGQSGGLYYISSDGVNNASNYTTGNTDALTQSPFVGMFLQNGTGLGSLSYYLNSSQQTLNAAQLTSDTGVAGFTLAFREDYPQGGYLDGDISEIIVTDTVINSTERQTLENYLNTKYRLYSTSSLPSVSVGIENTKSSISFGNKLAGGSSVLNGKSITSNVPAGTGTVNVVVTNSDNQSATLTNGFTYSTPAITSVSPNSSATLGGDTVTITGANFASPGYKKTITINNPVTATITNYEGSLILDTASLINSGKLRTDCGDLRFKDSDGITDLSYYLESGSCNNPSTTVWFKKPSLVAGTNSVTLIYGNPNTSSQSNINNFSFGPIIGGANNKLWLAANSTGGQNADNSSISNLNDKSGSGNNAVQTNANKQPALKTNQQNGQPVIRFDGNSDGMSAPLPFSGTTNFTLFSVTNHTVFGNGGSTISWGPDSTTAFYAGPYYYPAQGGSKFISAWGSAASASLSSQDAFISQPKLSSSVYNGSTNIMYINGQAGTTGAKNNSNFTGGTFDLGYTTIVAGGNYFNGDISEVLLFNTALSAPNRLIVENYLNTKYRLFDISTIPTISSGSETASVNILFDTTPATNVTLVNTTTITAKVPARASGVVNVTFSNSNGDTATLINGFTYAAPTITSISPNTGTTAGGNDVTITGTNFASIGYKKTIDIANPTAGAITNYEGNIKLDTKSLISAGKLRSDCGDLRFKDSDGITDLAYYIEPNTCNDANTLVWFKKPTLAVGSNQISVSYGNPVLTSLSNITPFSFASVLGSASNKLWLSAANVSDQSYEVTPTFANQVGVTVNGGTVTKSSTTAGWNAGFSTTNAITTGKGYISGKIPSNSFVRMMMGLSNGNTDSNYTDIDYAIYAVQDGSVQVYQGGNFVGNYGTYTLNDVLSVELLNNKVLYKKNGVVLYQSAITPTTTNLIGDSSFDTVGSSFSDIKFCDGTCSGSSIGAWNDKTSNANNATQATATNSPVFVRDQLNGQPIIRFDGVNDVIGQSNQLASNNFTTFFIAKPNTTTPIPGESLSSSDTSTRNYLAFPEITPIPDSGSGIAFGTNGISVHEHAPSYLTAPAVTTSNNGSNFSSVGYTYTNKATRIDLNGQIVRNGLTSARTNIYAPKSFGGGPYGYFNGDIAEIMIFDSSLSSLDRQAIEGYINSKYRLYDTAILPSANLGTESTNFDILFDTSFATKVVLVNPTTITATTPAHASGAVNVQFKNSNGDVAILTNGFTYAGPVITSVSPASGPTAGGNEVTINGNYFSFGDGNNYKREITINSSDPSNIANYQIALNIDTASLISQNKMRSDCGDIRFGDGQNVLSYWLDTGCNTTNTKVWVKIPNLASGANRIYFSYGNLAFVTASNPDNVFVRRIGGLVSAFTMDGNVATVADDTQNTNNMTGANTTVTNGKFGNARGFNGSNSSFTKASVSLPTGSNMSAVAWVKPSGYTDSLFTGIASWGARPNCNATFLMSIQSSGRPSMANWCSDYTPLTGAAATLNTWNHEAVTMSGRAVSLYMNNSVSSGTLPSDPAVQSVNFAIGSTDFTGRLFNGSIDELSIYNRALTPAEISDLYSNYGYSSTALAGETLVTKYSTSTITNTILGEAANSTITINNIPVLGSQFISPTQIKVIAPPNPIGTYAVKITGSDGSNSNTNITYSYVGSTVTSVTPNVGPNSGGALVTVNGTNFASLGYSSVPLTITNTNSTALTDYQTKFTLDTASLITGGKMANDCANIRIRDVNNNNLPYWIESGCNTNATIIWTKIPSIAANRSTTVNIIYGQSGWASQSDGNSVFDLFDDFNAGAIDTNKWDKVGNTWTQSAGEVQMPITGTAGVTFSHLVSKTFTATDAVIETIMTPLAVGSSQGKGVSFRYTDSNNQYTGFLEAYNTNITELVRRSAGNFTNISATPTNGGVVANSRYRQVVSFAGTSLTNTVTKLDTNQTTTTTTTDSTFTTGKVALSVDRDETATGAKFDFILVRKYAAVQPTTTLGTETKAINVTFGTNSVIGKLINQQTILVYTPNGTGTVNVTVINTDGGAATGTGVYTYGTNTISNAITDLSVSNGTNEPILTWTAPNSNGSPITDYIIKYSQDNFATETVFNNGVGAGTSSTVTGLIPGQSYKFKVVAVNGVGNSADSNIASVTKLDCDTDLGGADFIISTNQVLTGRYCNINLFQVNTGIIATLSSEAAVKIYAQNANILGTIDATAKGYLGYGSTSGSGPGLGGAPIGGCFSSSAGGSYGGKGGVYNMVPSNTYGSISQPTDLGSGGNACTSEGGGNGGGAIKLSVAGILTNSGSILANGGNGNGYRAGGSGGSIWLQAGTLAGAGSISANGGDRGGSNGAVAGGGGGRIALYYNTNTFSGITSAFGGIGGQYGGAGTIYQRDTDDAANPNGNLLISNEARPTGATTPFSDTSNQYKFDNLTIQNANVPYSKTTNTLNIVNNLTLQSSDTIADTARLATLTLSGTDVYNIGNIIVKMNGVMTHDQNANTQANILNIISNTVETQLGGTIDATSKGYLGGGSISGSGPGLGGVTTGGCYTSSAGGSYGGKGGNNNMTSSNVYGSITQPTDLGSGGNACTNESGGNGGGAIKLTVASILTNSGSILANGGAGSGYRAGGSGGSIWLQAGTLAGAGTITANGGDRGGSNSTVSGGGGGRIALYYQNSTTTMTTGTPTSSIRVNGGIGGGDCVEVLTGTNPAAYTNNTSGCTGTIYDPNTPEVNLTSVTLSPNPNPPSVGTTFTLGLNNVKNIFGFNLLSAACSLSVTGPGAYTTAVVRTGTVVSGVCTPTLAFTAPDTIGTYTVAISITGGGITQTASRTFEVFVTASNKAKEDTANSGQPIKATFTETPNPTIIGQANPTFTVTGLVDSGNNQPLNGTPCIFTVTGPNSFSQTYTSANTVGGACTLTLPTALPSTAGTYSATLSVLGATGTLTTTSISFDRLFDVYLQSAKLPGSTTVNSSPIIFSAASPLFTSPVIKKLDNTTNLAVGTVCKIVVQIGSDPIKTYNSTINSNSQCTATVPNADLYDGVLKVKSIVTISGSDFETDFATIATAGFPSYKAKESSTSIGQPIYSSRSVSPVPTYAGEGATLTVSGLLDSTTSNTLVQTPCTFNVTGPNGFSQSFSSTTALNGICNVTLTPAQLPKVAGAYSFTLSVQGASGILTTPAFAFTEAMNIYTVSNIIPDTLTLSQNPINVGQNVTVISPVIRKANNTTVITPGTTCKNVIQLNLATPIEIAGTTNGGGQCVTVLPGTSIIAPGNATIKTVVSLLGSDFNPNYTFETANTIFNISYPPTSQVCANITFRDDNSNGIQDGAEPLLAGVTMRLKNSNTSALIASLTTTATGPNCFTGLYDGTYILEGVTPVGSNKTLPVSSSIYTVTVATAATQNRIFGYNGDQQICPNPTFRDINEDGVLNGADSAINGVTAKLYLASDLNNALETIVTNSVLCFAPRNPGSYVVEQIIPANSVPTSVGTIANGKIQRPVTHAFANQSNVNFGYKLIATNKAKAQVSPNNNKPVNSGTIVNTSLTVYKNKNFVADTNGLIDTGTQSPLTGIPCTMIFSGPSFNSPITKAGTVTNGVCHVDPVPDNAATGNQVITQVAGENGTLQTDPQPFDVLAGLATICPAPYKDYNSNGLKDTTEPYYPGIVSELYNGATLLQTITSNAVGNICFAPVDHSINYTIKQTTPTGGVLSTVGYTIAGNVVQTSVNPNPDATETRLFGYRGTGIVCPNSTFRDDNSNGTKDGSEPNINGFTATLKDDNNIVIGNFVIDNTACFTNLLAGNITLTIDPGTLNITNTTGGNTKSVTLASGQNVSYSFGYQNNAKICALPYNDYNANGIKEANEGYITGLSTQLIRLSDSQVIQTINSTGSTTCFSSVIPDSYEIRQTPTAGFVHLVSSTPVSPVVTSIGPTILGVDYTTSNYYSGTGTICFTAYQDLNLNGARDSGEAFINGTTATLKDALGATISTVALTADPSSCFVVFATPQQYQIDVLQPSNTVSTTGGNSQTFTLTAGATVTRSFGYDGRPTICPEVFRDDNSNGIKDVAEIRITGATITLKDATNTTTISSFVSSGVQQCFGPLALGNYQVVSSTISSFSSTTSQDQTVNLQFASPSNLNFGYNGNGSICVNPTFKDTNQNGQYDTGELYYQSLDTFLRLSSNSTPLQTVQTNASGIACFAATAPGTYVVTQTVPLGGTSTTGGNQTIVLPPGEARTTSFGYTGGGILCPNPTFDDANFDGSKQSTEPVLAGVSTELFLSPNLITPIATLVTNSTGTSCFQNLFNGNYTVKQTAPSGYNITTSGGLSQNVTMNSGDNKSVTFGYSNSPELTLGSIRGFLFVDRNENNVYNAYGDDTIEATVYDNEVPVTQQNVLLQKFSTVSSTYENVASITTSADGRYSFNSLGDGNYKVVILPILGLKAVQPNPAEKLITILASQKSFNNDFGFQYTARVCPELYIDKNNNSVFDGNDFDILQNEGRYYQLLYTSFNGTQIASNNGTNGFFVKKGSSPCIENVPPRDYTLILRAPNTGGSYSNADLSFYSILTPNNSFTVYLAGQIESTNRYYSTFEINRATSTIKGKIWNNKNGTTPGFDANGEDNQTGISGGHNYDFDNDFVYAGVNLELIKCGDGFQDTIPTATWNLNPPTAITDANGNYTFGNIIPGVYGVRRLGTVPDESIMTSPGIGPLCSTTNSYNFFNYYTPTPGNAITPGSTVGHDYVFAYRGVINPGLYIDYNHNLQQDGWENSCLNQFCTSFLKAIFTLKDATNGNILMVYDGINNQAGIGFATLTPGDYTIEVSSPNTAYPTITPGELTRNTTISTTETDTLKFGFAPPDNSTFKGRVYIDRFNNQIYSINGNDNNPATTYDNDVPLQSYSVELYYGAPGNGSLITTVQTAADGAYTIPGVFAEGGYTIKVVNAAPPNTSCRSCIVSPYLYSNTNPSFDMTYDFESQMRLMSFHDTLANAIRGGDELDAGLIKFKVTYSDGYVVGDNIPTISVLSPGYQLSGLMPGSYTVEVISIPPGISLAGNYLASTNYSIAGTQGLVLDYPFTPYTNNTISGRAFIDRGTLNNIYEQNGQDNNAALTFDNESVLANATVRISGPGGIVSAITDSSGNYTINNLPTGRYYFNSVDISGSLAPVLKLQCATAFGCGNSGYVDLYSGQNSTNNYTYAYTGTIVTQYIDDKNGDGSITTYPSLNYTESPIGGTAFELETFTSEILSCSGLYIVQGRCLWSTLPPGNYTVKKLANLPNKINTNTTRSGENGTNIANLGNINTATTNLNSSSINQIQYFNFFQFSPVNTNNASITGRAFIDRNSNIIYQSSGSDNLTNTIEDNDYPIPGVPINLTGTSTTGTAINRTTVTGGDGRYQFTDLPGGGFQINAGNP